MTNLQNEININDLGLTADLTMFRSTPMTRRRILTLGMAGIASLLAGCTPRFGGPAGGPPPQGSGGPTSGDPCVVNIPGETAGPYPADGSNASNQTLNALTKSGIVRQDLRTSLSTGKTAAGTPLTITLELVNTKSNCAALAGYAVYLWHCDRDGNYSMYSSGITGEDYLRGVQVSDASGKLSFKTIYPGCYDGRWPHAHFEIYSSLANATTSKNMVHTSQIAFPEDVCKAVYAGGQGYATSTRNLSRITLASDNVFSDGTGLQMATLTGSVAAGYTATLKVGV